MMWKAVVSRQALVAAAVLLSACAPPATPQVVEQTVEVPVTQVVEVTAALVEPTAAVPEPVTLVVWADPGLVNAMTADPDRAGAYLITLKRIFEDAHPGVTVEFQDQGWDEQLRQNLTNALLAGTAPDVIVGEGFFKNYAAVDALLPIDISSLQDNMIAGTYQGALYDGQVYGISGYTGVFGFERNCEVITAAGLECADVPQTWDELLADARAVTAAGGGQSFGYTLQGPAGFSLGAAFRIAVLLNQVGAPLGIPGPDGLDTPNFNDPNSVVVYEFLRQINETTPPGLTFEGDENILYSQLHNGVTAFQIAGSWHVNWARDNGCTTCEYSEIPVAVGGQPASVVVANVMYGVLKVSRHPELALEFVRATQDPELQAIVFESTGRLPSTRSGLEALRPDADPATQAFIDVLLNSQNLSGMPQWERNPQKIWQVYNDFLTQLFTTDTPVQELIDAAQAAAEEALR